MKNLSLISWLVALLLMSGVCQAQSELNTKEVLSTLPVQSGGRLKPLDTLARETVRLVTGKATFEKRDSVENLLLWWANPEETAQAPIIEFRDLAVKKELGLDESKRWFTYQELSQNDRLNKWQEEIHQHLQNDEELHGAMQKGRKTPVFSLS